jgi:N-formylmaleamate deformylase
MKNSKLSGHTSKKNLLLIAGIVVVLFIGYDLAAKAAPSFSVDVVGNGKKSIILIPGLTCPGAVWNETVEQLKKDYKCHLISLPGFAGKACIQTDQFLLTMRDEIVQYIKDEKLKKPIIIGHSLGGFLALWISSTNPDLVSVNIIVDSLPFLGATQNPQATSESAKPMAENMRKMMANATPEQVKASQKMFLPGMINNKDKYELVSKWGVDSHSPTVAQAMFELQVTDLRSDVSTIKTPTLVLGAWIAYKQYGMTKEMIQKTFDTQYEKLPNKKIVLSDVGKHFLMYDDTEWFMKNCIDFINSNGK